jgi:hypothetical protein
VQKWNFMITTVPGKVVALLGVATDISAIGTKEMKTLSFINAHLRNNATY